MLKLCSVYFGVIVREAETLVKCTNDVLHVLMYVETRFYALQKSIQGLSHYIWRMIHNIISPKISDMMVEVSFEDQNIILCWFVIVFLILFNINGIIDVVFWFYSRAGIVRIFSELFVVIHLSCWCNGDWIHNHVSHGIICYSLNTSLFNSIY